MKISSLLIATVLSLSPISDQLKKDGELKINQKAPVFEMKDVTGVSQNLSSKKGKKIFISFLRFAACPVCNVRVHNLIEAKDQFIAQNIEVILVFESGEEILKQYVENTEIPFVVISDTENRLYDLYQVDKSLSKMLNTMRQKQAKADMKKGKALFGDQKVKTDGSMTRIPADFLINENGVLEKAHYGQFIGDHLDLNSIL